VVEHVLANRECGSALKAQAVLFRASHHSGQLEIELTRRNIPFVKFGGLKFLEAAHVKDVLALLRFVENPRDRVAGFRIVLLLPGIGPISAARILDELAAGGPGPTPLRAVTVPSRAAEACRRWSTRSRNSSARAQAGPPSSNGSVLGMTRISSAGTRMPLCGGPIWRNSCR
jgi:superfamily I DNA/RNA helicase